jgi:hypothetical protein
MKDAVIYGSPEQLEVDAIIQKESKIWWEIK